jgi:hypothetical protein
MEDMEEWGDGMMVEKGQNRKEKMLCKIYSYIFITANQ